MNSSKTAADRRLIPDGIMTEQAIDRFAHRDLERDDFTAEKAWAESQMLCAWLAEQIFHGRRPNHIWIAGTEAVSDHAWARERIQRLRAVVNGRRPVA